MSQLNKFNIFIIAFILVFILCTDSYGESRENYHYYTATITELEEDFKEYTKIYSIKARFTEGPYENKNIDLTYMPVEGTPLDINFREGMSIIVSLKLVDGNIEQATIFDVNRKNSIKILVIIFICVLIFFGGFKGIGGVLSLIFTFLLIIFCLIPLILKGLNPILVTIVVSSIAILINFLLVSGFSKKSFCAIVGTIGGTIISGIFALYFGNLMALTGFSDDSVQTLITHTDLFIDFKGLLFSGIILGTMGAIMDVGMSISSFIFEIKKDYPNTSSLSLFKSGLNVGKDIMSTMTNTLVLAYSGASLPLFLYFTVMDNSFINIINMEIIAEEILRSLCGSIGLVLTIPLTSFIASIKA